MSDIPGAAVEAAAEALWGDFTKGDAHHPSFYDYSQNDQDYWRHDARVALSAALPSIEAAMETRLREQIAGEIEDEPRIGTDGNYWDEALDLAARIVRGGNG